MSGPRCYRELDHTKRAAAIRGAQRQRKIGPDGNEHMKTLKQTLALIAIAASTLTGAHAESPNDYAYLILRSDQDGQSDCVMREKGYARLKNPILIAGKSYNEDQCTVAMSASLTLRVQHPSWSYRNGGMQIGVSIDD